MIRHFSHLSAAERKALFHCEPEPLDDSAPMEMLGLALGATLYTPAMRSDLSEVVLRQAERGVSSMVLDLEYAVPDDDVAAAQANLVAHLHELAGRPAEQRPMIFARVRNPDQLGQLVTELGDDAGVLAGFVLPKFDDVTGAGYLDELTRVSEAAGIGFYAMPVLESPGVIFRESRLQTLLAVKQLLEKHRQQILAVRIGATDLCGLYGLRRDRDLSIYDLRFIGDAIADIVNVLGRAGDGGFLVSAPVWEYFENHERLFKPQLRATPFERQHRESLRKRIVTRDIDRLIREVVLDKANGLSGKTVIHPSHVAAVHALLVVTHEEFVDASDIVAAERPGGVRPSGYGNKMNELKPHRAWAERTMRRARVFGVAEEDTGFVDLLVAGALR